MNRVNFKNILCSQLLLICFIATVSFSNTVYVATDGDDSNPGTLEQPIKTITKALSFVEPGTTIYLRGGTYRYSSKISLSKDGTSESPINLWAYADEIPILDFADGGINSNARGFNLSGDYWWLKGFIIQHAGDNAINVSGAHNVLENIVARYNHDSGIQLHTGSAFNLVLNCDSYGNYDEGNHGENADGFAAKFSLGQGNEFKGCRSWNNSDDGYDFWEAGNGVTVEDCQAFRNGVNRWGDTSFEGDGNGYKLGHGSGAHVLIRCLAFDHPAHGIDVNGNVTGVTLYNCAGYRNGKRDFNFDDSLAHKLRNNLSVEGDVRMDEGIDHQFNSWNGMTISKSDFLSLDTTGVTTARNTDGSLVLTDFLQLANGSPLIDAGVDVGLPFAGSAPDIGAYEWTSGAAVIAEAALPSPTLKLYQNYPNPFNPHTHIQFYLPGCAQVTVTVYSALGQRVATLINETMMQGKHTVVFNGERYASGIYFYEIKTPQFTCVNKMILMR